MSTNCFSEQIAYIYIYYNYNIYTYIHIHVWIYDFRRYCCDIEVFHPPWIFRITGSRITVFGQPVLDLWPLTQSCWGRKAKWQHAWGCFQEAQGSDMKLDVVTYSVTISAAAAAAQWQHASALLHELRGCLVKLIRRRRRLQMQPSTFVQKLEYQF